MDTAGMGPTESWPRTADHSCLRTAWPFRVSTLKLLVRAGMMKNATTVCSLPFTWGQGGKRHQDAGLSRVTAAKNYGTLDFLFHNVMGDENQSLLHR